MPDEVGVWHYRTQCSDADNLGLHEQEGQFVCEPNASLLPLHQHGAIGHRAGERFLRHADDTPFFYAACTAWNGPLKSTEAEWNAYLAHRAEHHYTAIQFVATQWRGLRHQQSVANCLHRAPSHCYQPGFFQHLDHKVDQINAHGLLAAPVLLWALPFGAGRSLSPGVTLPRDQAVLLAQYIVARYGGHHVLWLLGGDGYYLNFYERRWEAHRTERFRRHFSTRCFPNGQCSGVHFPRRCLAPHGPSVDRRSVCPRAVAQRGGLPIGTRHRPGIGGLYHPRSGGANLGAVARATHHQYGTCYEELRPEVDAESGAQCFLLERIHYAPGGITYGANGIWPWIRPGERILNHGALGDSQRARGGKASICQVVGRWAIWPNSCSSFGGGSCFRMPVC